MNLTTLPYTLTVHRFAADAHIPPAALTGRFFSVTRTADELSIVCDTDLPLASEKSETGWRCLQVIGPLDFALTGILARLATTLAEASISIFAISTFDTDYLLVKADKLTAASEALRDAGHSVA